MSTTKIVTQQPKIDNKIFCLNTADEVNQVRAAMAEVLMYTDDHRGDPDYTQSAQNLRERIIPSLLERLDVNDLEAVRRLCEGMATHPAEPYIFNLVTFWFDVRAEMATDLYHKLGKGVN